MKLFSLFPPVFEASRQIEGLAPEVRALHSGNIGDVIYSLPTAFALGVTHYVLNVCADPTFGHRVMNSDAAEKLAKLLINQGSIRRVSVIRSNVPWEFAEPSSIGIEYVLDAFRGNWAEDGLHLIHRHALPFGIKVRGDKRWVASGSRLDGDVPAATADRYIVIGLTRRYRRWGDDFYADLLRDIPAEHIIFVGVEGDLPHKVNLPGAYLQVDDFAQLARVMTSAALVIGNPSFPYALAEALKVPRLAELPDGINIAPLDASGLAMHTHTIDSLRTRIFDALDRSPPELVCLRVALNSKEVEIARLSREKNKLAERLAVAEELLRCRRASSNLIVVHEAQKAPARLHLTERFKQSARRLALSNRIGRTLYHATARIEAARALWRRIGSR
jgi:hypothetical protein